MKLSKKFGSFIFLCYLCSTNNKNRNSMTRIKNYMNDGANWQSQAVLAYMRGNIFRVEDWVEYEHKDILKYFTTKVGRYENCREQGYVFSIQFGTEERHYAVYEHRNSDNLIVLISEGLCMDTPGVNFMWKDKGENATKYDYDREFGYGEIVNCGEWIIEDMLGWIDKLAVSK